MNKSLLLLAIGMGLYNCTADNFPAKEWTTPAHDKPLIFYITGDGGFNNFSTPLCQSLNTEGYDVFALNAKTYFWDKRTPEETTIAIDNYLAGKLYGRVNQQVVFIGYSFGADITPFILNRASQMIKQKIIACLLMAPSPTTDFEIHWTDILGFNKKRRMDVVAEVNKLNLGKLTIISGSDEDDFPYTSISVKNYKHEVLPGGHHFDGNTKEVVQAILRNSK